MKPIQTYIYTNDKDITLPIYETCLVIIHPAASRCIEIDLGLPRFAYYNVKLQTI